jgi:hypothetical protein
MPQRPEPREESLTPIALRLRRELREVVEADLLLEFAHLGDGFTPKRP